MPDHRVYGDAVPNSFSIKQSPRLVTGTLRSAQIAINRLSIGDSHFGMSPVIPPEDTFIVAFYLNDLPHHELWSHGRPAICQGYRRGAMRIVNLSDEYSAKVTAPHETLVFYIPRAALDEFAEDSGLPRIQHLSCEAGTLDPIMARAVAALLPAFEVVKDVSTLYVDHVTLAICGHLGEHYGRAGSKWKAIKGGLTPRQVARSEAFIRQRFASDISLKDLTDQCGLSRAHLAKAFKTSLGVTPHQWLLQYRIEIAKAMMMSSTDPIEAIAIASGFADQSHMTRVFTRQTGSTPAQWRRRQTS